MTLDDSLVYFGDPLKSLDDSGKFGGYLLRFGSPDSPDLSRMRDYFTAETNLGLEYMKSIPGKWYHSLDPSLDDRTLVDWEFKTDAYGVWVEGILKARDQYEEKIRDMAMKGMIGLSAGAVPHLMRRQKQPNGTHWVKSFPIYEGSLTPTPADPHLAYTVHSLKSLISETGTGYAPANPIGDLSRAGTIDGLSRMSSMTHAAVMSHLHDSSKGREDMLLSCGTAYDAHKTAAMRMLRSMSKEHPEPDSDDMKSLMFEYALETYKTLRMGDHLDAARAVVSGMVDRLGAYHSLKSAEGHTIPAARAVEIGRFRDDLNALVAACQSTSMPSVEDTHLTDNALAAAAMASLAIIGA